LNERGKGNAERGGRERRQLRKMSGYLTERYRKYPQEGGKAGKVRKMRVDEKTITR